MTDSNQPVGRLTTLEAVLTAEHLIAAFDNHEGSFAAAFYAADRDVLGALIAYASLGVREVAVRESLSLAQVRQQFRLRVSDLQSASDQKEETE